MPFFFGYTPTEAPLGGYLGSLSYDSTFYDIPNNYDFAQKVNYSLTGDQIYIGRSEGTADEIGQLSLSTDWAVTGSPSTNGKLNVASQDGAPANMYFAFGGTSGLMMGAGNATVYRYTFSTPYDITTGTYASDSYAISGGAPSKVIYWDTNGFIVLDPGSDEVRQFTCSTENTVSTATEGTALDISSETSTGRSGCFNATGTLLLIADNTDTIYEYYLSTPFDITTATYSGISLNISGDAIGGVDDIQISGDETKLLVLDGTSRGTLLTYSSNITSQQMKLQYFDLGSVQYYIAGLGGGDIRGPRSVGGSYLNSFYEYDVDAWTALAQAIGATDTEIYLSIDGVNFILTEGESGVFYGVYVDSASNVTKGSFVDWQVTNLTAIQSTEAVVTSGDLTTSYSGYVSSAAATDLGFAAIGSVAGVTSVDGGTLEAVYSTDRNIATGSGWEILVSGGSASLTSVNINGATVALTYQGTFSGYDYYKSGVVLAANASGGNCVLFGSGQKFPVSFT